MTPKVLLGAALAMLAWGQQAPPPAEAPAVVEGIVVGPDGKPLPQANLTMLPLRCSPQGTPPPPGAAPPPRSTTSGADGRFSFQHLEPSDCNVIEVSYPGFPAVLYPSDEALLTGRNPGFTLKAGQRLTDLTITVQRSVLSGKVTDEDGHPMPGVLVRPIPQPGVGGRIQIVQLAGIETDSKGEFTLSNLSFGPYYLGFSLPPGTAPVVAGETERAYINTYYPGVSSMLDAKAITAQAGHDMPGLNMQLRRAPVFHVRGKVVGLPDNFNLAAGEVRVVLVPPDGDLYSARTNPGRKVAAGGAFDYGGVPAGDWTFILSGHEINLYQRPLPIADHNVDNLVVTVQPPATLTGVIKVVPEMPDRVPPGNPVGMPGFVRFIPHDAVATFSSAHVYPDGTFTVYGLGASNYAVETEPPSGAYVKSATFAGHDVLANGLDLTKGVSKGQLEIVVGLQTARVSGTVRNEAGEPAAGVLVMAISTTRPYGLNGPPEMATDAAGQYSFKLAPGTYQLFAWETVRGLDLNGQSAAAFLKQFASLGTPVTVAEDDRKQAPLRLISTTRLQEELRRRDR